MHLSSRSLLRLEGLAVLTTAAFLFPLFGYSWWLFVAALLAPDLFIAGYLAGPKVGGLLYNIGHTYLAPLGLGVAGHLGAAPLAMALSVIWAAHIGMDRTVGYGLKSPTGFHVTHLSTPEILPESKQEATGPAATAGVGLPTPDIPSANATRGKWRSQ